ncbi:hypothetical protein CC2G_006924 [Coprinopsis cinerea AmutBmut pab1-1]|nr:hypothetical protein CC2G_006924 [Coprinopsis cinerea AmutBmut pab1-1]
MVRFKNRWLLVEFIPIPTTASGGAPTSRTTLGQLPNNSAQLPPLDGKQIWTALKQSILTNFGDVGWGSVAPSLTVKYFSPTTNTAIIRVAREHHKIAWAGLTLLSTIGGVRSTAGGRGGTGDGVRYIPNVVHLSGTIKHCQLAAIEHNRVVVARYRALANNPAGYQDSYDAFLEKTMLEIQALQD